MGCLRLLIVDEKICNMLAYILGEELLGECPTVQAKWDEELTEEDITAIKAEVEAANI